MNSPAEDLEPSVVVRREGRVGHLMLNRPRAINALTHEMVGTIQATLDAWVTDPDVKTVLLSGSGDRGLCAGGDIVSIYHDALAKGTASASFWADEYHLDATIAAYPKPFVALMDGIVLGGGIGISAHADVRIVTERSSIGMPETSIGFFPDVGGTWLLSHAPGQLGTHLALTAGSVKAGDAIAVGLADWYVPSERLSELTELLTSNEPAVALAKVSEPAPAAPLEAERPWIDECYAGADLVTIVARLQASSHEDAHDAAARILTKSPTSVSVTLRALRIAARLPSLEAALDQEYRLAVRFLAAPDFVEGVRAQVIEKDRSPRWTPATLGEVTEESLQSFFAPLASLELGLDTPADGSTDKVQEDYS